jgi:tetratricopeptide (TPR) repeat protein
MAPRRTRRQARQKPRQAEQSHNQISPLGRILLACTALCAITLLVYSNSFRSGFVFDNYFLILHDPRIVEATARNMQQIWQHTYYWPQWESGLYRPVTTLSYLLNYALLGEGDHPAGYHWFNFSLQALNVLLVFGVSLRLVRKFWPSALIAAVWAVHPVLTESVTNIIGRSDLLAGAAILSGFLLYLKSTESRGWHRAAWLIGLGAVTAAGVFSKESAVMIVGVIALFELTWWKERREIRGFVLGCAAMAPAILAMLYQRAVVLAASPAPDNPFTSNPLFGADFFQARLTAIAVMARYLWLLVWPARLSADYSYHVIPLAGGGLRDWIAWCVVVAVFAAGCLQFTRNKVLFFFSAFALVTFLPSSNLLFSIGTIMAERFLYLPAIGFAACLVLGIFYAGERTGARAAAPVLLCVIVAALGIRTWERNRDWQDHVTLWTSTVATVPDSYKAHEDLSWALFESDPTHANLPRVLEEAEKSLAILDPLPDARNAPQVYALAATYYRTEGDLLLRLGPDGQPEISPASLAAYQRALQILKRGISMDRVHEDAYMQRERARGKSEAELPPEGFIDLYKELSNVSMRLGDPQTALGGAMYAHKLDPEDQRIYLALSGINFTLGRTDEAATMLVEGLLVSGSPATPEFLGPLQDLYRSGLDPKGCAISGGAHGQSINGSCEPVHSEICMAAADLLAIYRRNQRSDLVGRTEKTLDAYGSRCGTHN